ncbi:hypothetical protein L596_003670 [Steinernema carpocapsae]|uniref:Uncharacterized protein n=1 Tax=Steinernema carpocapsae TaxID=34508 RepID=A0A4U8UUD1_STECR|nr:hypothetical protein L596_003670 [Steinernema carpocapsae]
MKSEKHRKGTLHTAKRRRNDADRIERNTPLLLTGRDNEMHGAWTEPQETGGVCAILGLQNRVSSKTRKL